MAASMNATVPPSAILPAQMAALLPNPFTPMAFLPPAIASQVTVSAYVLIATASILLWDVLTHLRDDYCLLTRHRVNFSMVAYFISRIFNMVYLIGYTVLNTAPIGNCHITSRVIDSFYVIAVPSSELLLFLHVRAIYINNRYVVWLFTGLWLSTVGGALTPLIGASYMEIGITKYCINTVLPSYAAASAIIPLVNDSLLFGALVWRILRSSYANKTVRNEVQTMVFGDYIPQVSKALLQNGQAYFLSTVGINLATVILYYIDSLPLSYRAILGFPSIVLMNVMASRIYRNTKFGKFNVAPMRAASSALALGPDGPAAGAISLGRLGEQKRIMDSRHFDEQATVVDSRVGVRLQEKFDLESASESFNGPTVL